VGVAASRSWAAPHPATAIPEPGALQAIGKSVLDEESAAQRHLLEEFAQHYKDQIPGILAQLTLGYADLEGKRYGEAGKHFEAAGKTPGLLQDYAVYHQAASEAALGNHAAVVSLLERFPARYPASSLSARAIHQLGSSLLTLRRYADAIALLKSPPVALPEPESSFLLAQAYQSNNQLFEAVATYRKVFYSYPTNSQAKDAEKILNQLRAKMGGKYPASTAEMWALRADKLFEAGRWSDALSGYRTLAGLAEGGLLAHARVRVGACQFHLGSTWPALNALAELKVSEPEADAERLYVLAAAYRRLGRPQSMERQIEVLGERYPKSEWREKTLILAGNYYLLEKEYDRAGAYYRKSYEEFPHGETAATGHWKVAWQAYRERRRADAKRLLEEHIQSFPSSPQISAALYWLGRLEEAESPAAAVPYYRRITEVFPNYYYGLLARKRLATLPPASADSNAAIPLGHIQRTIAAAKTNGESATNEGLYRERARLLESAWLIDWAIREMQAVLARDEAALWAGSEMARLEKERERYHVALRYAKRYVPSYFARETSDLPFDTWELLFPRPYWETLKKQAAAAKVDPFLVAGLIRQESEFDPRARSRSNARGLMQLLPSTARMMARRVPDPKARNYRLASLYVPDINMVYGTYYLKKVLDQFDGTPEYALAGYNAGENRVVEWLRQGPFEEPAEFVESIPFTETREYVQAVLRNAAVYRQLYR
jgi:soluble lytic murein transglycosylase